jgi:2-keto-4-pentenoate hydratase/2-oxohepta-3-ene-1,7-dioic acid hydratase in catechol pathway
MRIVRYLDREGAIGHATADSGGGTYWRLDGDLAGGFRPTTEPVAVQRLLAPVVPPAILCIGLNYRRHAAESGLPVPELPVMFMKAPSAVQDPDGPIVLPTCLKSDEVDYECELAVVIGRSCKNVAPEQALDYVLGYTCANDVSARDWQIKKGGGQWCRGKTFDTFCPLGPCIVTTDEIPDPNALGIRTLLNGQAVQDWNTNDMVFDVRHLIAFLSGSTTLQPGTVILTGTPHGVGMAARPPRWLRDGDHVVVEIDGIGRLSNSVQAERA